MTDEPDVWLLNMALSWAGSEELALRELGGSEEPARCFDELRSSAKFSDSCDVHHPR